MMKINEKDLEALVEYELVKLHASYSGLAKKNSELIQIIGKLMREIQILETENQGSENDR